jgi:hypothetical protein
MFNDEDAQPRCASNQLLRIKGGGGTRVLWNHALEFAFDACRRNRPLLNAYPLKIIPLLPCDFYRRDVSSRGAARLRKALFLNALKP